MASGSFFVNPTQLLWVLSAFPYAGRLNINALLLASLPLPLRAAKPKMLA